MTGKGILEAMSFVDEQYIEEAETGTIHSQKIPFLKVLIPLAACLCAAFLALYPGASTESVPAEGILDDSAMELEVHYKEESSMQGESDIALDAPTAVEVPSLILRIEEWTGEGFTAVVAEYVGTDLYPLGTVLNVEMLGTICIETVEGDLVNVERRVPTEADFPAGSLILVRFTSSVEEESTIFIESICKEE